MRPKINATSDSDLESIFSIEEPSPAGKTKEAKYVCTIDGCGQSFKRMVHLDRHEFKHTGVRKHPCLYPDCNKSYTIITHLKRHIKEYHERTEKPKDVKCRFDFCDKMFISEYNMERHIREVHEAPKIYTCTHCNENFKQRIKLKRHEVKHTGITPYNCEKCKKGFVQEYFFNRHVCKSYSCNVCEKIYQKWSELLAHRKAENHKQTMHKCDHCSKIFKRKYDLEAHEITHKDDEDKEVFVCTFEGCSRFYSFQRNLVQHIRVTHEGHKFPCTVEGCSANLGSKRALENHVRAIHSEKKPKAKKSNGTRAQRKDAGTRKRSALSKLSGVLMDKDVDKKVMAGTADIQINVTDADVPMQDETHCSSDVEDPTLVVLEISQL